MKLGKALKMGLAKSIQINDTSEYTIAGVQSYGKGVINRRNEIGKNLKMKKYQVIEPDYLMWCKVDTKNGAFGITKEEHRGSLASTNMALAKIDTEKFNPSFIEKLFSFDFFHKNITHLSSGSTNRKYLTPKQLFEMVEIPAINKNEQDDFILLVDKIERIDLNSELTHQLDLIKQLRQAFLREAMQGKLLTPVTSSGVEKQETGHDLLAKIKAEKAQLIAEKKLKKEKELPPITNDEIPFEIPEHWAWCRLGDLGNFRRGPFGSALTKGIFVKTGYKVYEQKNAIYDNHTLGEYYITSEKFEELKGFIVKPHDLIVSCSGATLGRIAEIPEGAEEGIINQALMRMTLFQMGITNSFFIKLFRSPYMQKKIFDKAWGSAIPNMVGLVEIKKILIPLPPLHEQEQIVAKLEELMAFCDGLEQSIKESQGYNEKFLQQVLREALQGKKERV